MYTCWLARGRIHLHKASVAWFKRACRPFQQGKIHILQSNDDDLQQDECNGAKHPSR